MAKKKSFEDAFLNIGTETETNKESNIAKTQVEQVQIKEEIRIINQEIVNTTNIANELTLHQYIQQKVQELEHKISSEHSGRFKPKKRLSYSDKYVGITISIRPELKAIVEDIRDKTSLDKYEIMELLLICGLKSVNFDEE